MKAQLGVRLSSQEQRRDLELNAGQLPLTGGEEHRFDLPGRDVRRHAFGTNIGNAIAIGVRALCAGTIRYVAAQAIGRAQPRPFTEQNDRKARTENFPHFIRKFYPGKRRDENRIGRKATGFHKPQ